MAGLTLSQSSNGTLNIPGLTIANQKPPSASGTISAVPGGIGFSNDPGKVYTFGAAAPTPAAAAKTSAASALDKQIADSTATIKALQYQIAQQPKLPYFDTSANWAKAQSAVTGSVHDVYNDKLNSFLAKQALTQKQKTEDTNANINQLDLSLSRSLADNAETRTQTDEDVTNKLGDIGANENSFQTQEGNSFDKARTALLGTIANSGLTESGIGRGQEASAITDRNLSSADQVREFNNQRRDTNIFKERTFGDLEKSDTRNTEDTATSKAMDTKQLQDYIDTAKLTENDFRTDNETAMQNELYSATSKQAGINVNDFIASLVASGARPQDIALAKSIYG